MGYGDLMQGIAPGWFGGPNLTTLIGACGAELDARALQILNGRMAAVPYCGPPGSQAKLADGRLLQCEPAALPAHSFDRGIPLYATEGELSQRIRLSQWHQLHRARGTHFGEIAHMRPYFADFVAAGGAYPTIRIVYQNNAAPAALWRTCDPLGNLSIRRVSPSNWVWDGQSTKRCRWWAIIYLPPGFLAWASTAIAGEWDGASLWDGVNLWDGVPAAVLADLWQMLFDWKSAHSWFAGLIVVPTLTPTTTIPGQAPGVYPFDPASTSTTNANNSTNLPIGNWGSTVWTGGGLAGQPTRPSWATFFNISNG